MPCFSHLVWRDSYTGPVKIHDHLWQGGEIRTSRNRNGGEQQDWTLATRLRVSPSWQERPGTGLLDAWGVQPAPVYTAGFKAVVLAASVPIRSRTLGPVVLIDREHGSTLLVSDDWPSGAPAQKSKQHQDHVSDSHNDPSLLPALVGSMQSRSSVRRQEKCATMPRGSTFDREQKPALNVSRAATSARARMVMC